MINSMERLIGSECPETEKNVKYHEIRPYFTDVERKAQHWYMTRSKSHSLWAIKLKLNTGLLTPVHVQTTINVFIHSFKKHFECLLCVRPCSSWFLSLWSFILIRKRQINKQIENLMVHERVAWESMTAWTEGRSHVILNWVVREVLLWRGIT